MRSLLVVGLIFSFLFVCIAQEKSKWKRLITYDDSALDLNLTKVTLGEGDSGKVEFRTTLNKPAPLRGVAGASYKSLDEDMEFRCADRAYRLMQVTYYDSKGKVVSSEESKPPVEWKSAGSSTMMKLLTPACALIREKRQSP